MTMGFGGGPILERPLLLFQKIAEMKLISGQLRGAAAPLSFPLLHFHNFPAGSNSLCAT